MGPSEPIFSSGGEQNRGCEFLVTPKLYHGELRSYIGLKLIFHFSWFGDPQKKI